MAYEFSPDTSIGGPVPDGDGGQVIEFALGYDADSDLIVLMAVMLTRTERDDTLEFHFGIRSRIGSGPASEPDYSKEAVDKYIPKKHRSSIKALISECTQRILRSAQPEYIIMETYYPNLDAKALEKYEAIRYSLATGGYRVADAFRDEITGINYWLFRHLRYNENSYGA